jgi:cytochrome c553
MKPYPSRPLISLLGCLLLAPSAQAAEGDAIMQKGGSNPAALPCITCHGADGKGMATAGFPRLAGLPAAYLAKQLHDFKAGTRQNPIMQPIADALTETEISAVTQAYSERPKVNVQPSAPLQPVPGSGAWLAMRGAWERNIPECTLCHGPSGIGVGSSFPPLAAQSSSYIEAQLMAWRGHPAVRGKGRKAGVPAQPPTRQNDPNGLMQHIAASLTEAEVKSVAEYFGSLGDSSEPFDETQHRLR